VTKKLSQKTIDSIPLGVADEFDTPDKMTVSVWADKFRRLDTKTSAEPGQWSTNRTPYLKGIMDAFNDPFVDEITVMAASQVGKTEAMLNMLGFIIDQDPGPTLVVLPRADDARSISSNRIKPMIEESPALSKYLPQNTDAITKLEYQFERMILYFAGSNSPADLASRPIRYLFLDEVDKYPKFSGREADPIKLASERQKTFWNRKTVKVSTPTTKEGYICREYEKSDQRRFYVPCPHCGKMQVLLFGQVKWPQEDLSPEKIKNNRLAWYECLYCAKRIEDNQKHKMMLSGEWIPDKQELNKNRGFWISSLYSPWLTWSDIAAEFLKSKDYIELLMNFVNSWLAEIWEETIGKTKPEEVASLALPYPRGLVPAGVKVLTAGVDVQKDHFYLSIRGWGLHQESWLVLATRVEEWNDVVEILFKTSYLSEDSGLEPFGVRLTCIDTGYRTDEVYEVCRLWRDIARPIKGQKYIGGMPFKVASIDRYPATGQAIPGGLRLWHIDTTYFKDKISRLVKNTNLGSPGGWHLYKEPAQEYLRQFCGEHKAIIRDKKTGRHREEWQTISVHTQSHFFDTECYAIAAAEMIRVFAMQEDGKKVYPKEDTESLKHSLTKNWLPRRPNWIRR
jgi:phage terminase large subunit GpA-like protein